ncbi:SrfA family protein [Reyranella sp.]|uniref:SrfA family protein n=1 Tax=Reyranella sp. TaxID=1929291 RepID=UPI003BAB39B7
MAGETTLIATTRGGVRPLGVRGEPLHNAAAQLRRVVRRRLGDATAGLLADPQPHEDGKAIDWYADGTGPVQPLDALPPERQREVMADVERALADIRRLGDTLAGAGPKEERGIVGLSLQLAARAPAPSFIFVVGDRPVIACWGYEKDTAGSVLPALAAAPEPVPAPALPAVDRPVHHQVLRAPAALPVARPAAATIPWLRTLLLALPLLLLLLGGAWLLRELLPDEPDLSLATREGPEAPAAAEAPADPLPALKAAYTTEQSRARVLQVELSLIEAELRKRIAECKPPEAKKPAPKPPQVAVAPPKPAPAPQPPPQPVRPNDNRLRLPAPTNDYSFMSGCWRTDPFRHETVQMQPGISSYCFDARGNGQLEWRRGRTACRTRAQARFEGAVLRLRDSDTTCNDGSHWYADQLVCRRGADNVAFCSGSSRGAFGPVSWTVNLHKLR